MKPETNYPTTVNSGYDLVIGRRYRGVGSSGMTDGVPVEGVLSEIVGIHWYSILIGDNGQKYAAHTDSLKRIKP